jgi:hypothetical protein
MVTERDTEFEAWPAEPDPLTAAFAALIEAVVSTTETGSPARALAMTEVLTLVERVRSALHRPRLN